MLVQEFEGKTQQEAIQIALKTLKLEENKIKVEAVADEGKVSFFGFRTRKPVRIKVFYEEERESYIRQASREYLTKIFNFMGIEAELHITKESEDKIHINIQTENSAILIGKQGKTLEALQFLTDAYITNKIKQKNLEAKRVLLDIEGYLERRCEKIKQLAMRTASTVQHSKKSILLDAMNPYERHIVHTVLQDYKDIKTWSEGEGLYKKIRISCK